MSELNAAQRGDLAESMLPVAAHLAVLVHGDGGPEDVSAVIHGLTDTEKDALIVVLAGLVDPEQPMGKALGWLDFNEHGSLTVPPSWSEAGTIRDLVPDQEELELGDDYVDPAAVAKFVKGFRVEVTDADFLAAVQECFALGMTLGDVDRLRGWASKTAEKWVNRLRKRYQRAGREFPSLGPVVGPVLTERDVVKMRQRSERGDSDVAISMSFDVTRETVRAICTGKRYPHFGGPIRKVRSAKGTQASRDFMCGHGATSQLATKKHQLGEAA
ncbi:hypothetical protein OV320_2616 [Actinobacteria bacterium OV320]|jgi:hypothetical protein|nr:hypothetical protein OV320_2616 [Actinobacteria bacterium OV320]